jgi:hypothetical protein
MCIRNDCSFEIAQRELRRQFGIHHNRAAPSAHAIKADQHYTHNCSC